LSKKQNSTFKRKAFIPMLFFSGKISKVFFKCFGKRRTEGELIPKLQWTPLSRIFLILAGFLPLRGAFVLTLP